MEHARGTLPRPVGVQSEAFLDLVTSRSRHLPPACHVDDPLDDDDFQLALYSAYELHYRGFHGVDDEWEWDARLLAWRRELERCFEASLREVVPASSLPDEGDAGARVQTLIDEANGPSLSLFMAEWGSLEQFREFAIHRSLYQLKEADPHTWGIPRFSGSARSVLVEIQMDEYGNGVPGQAHADLFATTMRSLGLDATYGAYLDVVAAPTLATTNLISMLGLHRRLLPALLGHLALFEMTSVVPMSRYASALSRLGLGDDARRFYDVHVVADASHGPLARDRLAGDFGRQNPQHVGEVVWGAAAVLEIEDRFARHLLRSWSDGSSSLRSEKHTTV
jgi:hypothetical protein